ncbi:MAG: lipopolysaccharide biosynthesis protein [Solirubrobacterales bacterium]
MSSADGAVRQGRGVVRWGDGIVRRAGGAVHRVRGGRRADGAWRGGSVPVNTIVSAVRTIVRAIVAFAMLPLLIDRLGSAPTGLFIFATTLTGYFTAIEYGLGVSVTKYVAEHRATGDAEQLGSVLRASLMLLVGLGALVAVGIALLGEFAGQALFEDASTSSQVLPTLLVAALIALIYWPSRIGASALQGLERYDLVAIIQMISAVVLFGLVYVVSGVTHSVAVLTALFGVMLVFEGAAAGVLAWPKLGLRRGVGRWRGAHLRPALGFGGGLFLIGLSDTFVYESDRIVLATFVGAAAIVVYEVALRPHNGMRLISGLVGSALISTSSRLAAQDRAERLRDLIVVGSLYSVVLTVPCVILTLILAQPILEAWVGHGYGRYAIYVQIFVSYWLLNANAGVLYSAITGMGRIRLFVWFTVVGAVVALVLSIVLTIAWGTVGVIWGTVIPSWIGLPIWMYFALRRVGISKTRYAREVLIPGYVPIAAWTLPVLVLAYVLQPEGLLALGAFCLLTPLVLWLALLPMLRERWRRTVFDERLAAAAPA